MAGNGFASNPPPGACIDTDLSLTNPFYVMAVKCAFSNYVCIYPKIILSHYDLSKLIN